MTKTLSKVGTGIRLSVAAGAILLLASGPVTAQTNLFWSGNGTTQGGAGTWNTTVAHFDTTAGGPFNTIWNNANVDSAEFGNTGGIVNLGGPIVVNTITTDIGGFTIGNGNGVGNATNTITFSGANAGVNTAHTSGTTQLTALVSGTLTKTGPGRLELNNTANPNTSKYVINNGILTTPAISRFGSTAPASLVSDFLTFNGGGWGINTGNQDTGANRGITVKSGGAFFGSTSLTVNMTISSPIVGTEGGGVTIIGNAGPFTGNAHNAGAIVFLNNTSNSWNGDLTLNGGSGSKVIPSQSNVVPDTAVVNMLSAGNVFDMSVNNTTETVKSISGTAGTVAVGTGTLTVDDPNGETYSSVFTGAAAGKVIKNGSGVWKLSGGSSGFNGEFVMNGGTLGVGGSSIFGNGADGTDASTFTYNGGVLSNTGTGGRTIPAGVSVNLNADVTADDSLFTGPGQISFTGTATMNASRTITVNGTANLAFATVNESSAGLTLTKNGGGILVLSGNNSGYTGDTTVTNGTLRFTNGTAGTFAGNIFVPAGGRLEVDADGVVGSGNNPINLQGGTLSTSANRSVSFFSPVNITANSAISTTSAAATPQFDFGDTSTGNPFNISGGVTLITMRNDGADASSDQLRVRLFGGNFTISTPIDLAAGNLGSTTELSSFNTTGTTQTFSGVISGTGNYKRSASTGGTGGTTIMLAQNTFSGGVQLNDGTIELGVDSVGSPGSLTSGPVGTGTITIGNVNSPKLAANGGARNVGNAIAFSASNNVLGIAGSNNLTLTGDVSLGAATGAVSRTITVSNGASSVMSGVISDGGGFAGSLTKAGASTTLSLTGANTYTGDTSVTGGTLSIGTAYLADAADVYLSTGSIFDLNFTTGSPDVVDSLFFDGVSQATGTWGAIGSGATHESAFFTGTGRLQVTTFVPPPGVPGDFNSDGVVDAGDYITWRKNDGTNNALANDNGLGTPIGPAHYDLWRANFGNPPGAGSGRGLGDTTVPEPSMIALVATGLLAVGARRRR